MSSCVVSLYPSMNWPITLFDLIFFYLNMTETRYSPPVAATKAEWCLTGGVAVDPFQITPVYFEWKHTCTTFTTNFCHLKYFKWCHVHLNMLSAFSCTCRFRCYIISPSKIFLLCFDFQYIPLVSFTASIFSTWLFLIQQRVSAGK